MKRKKNKRGGKEKNPKFSSATSFVTIPINFALPGLKSWDTVMDTNMIVASWNHFIFQQQQQQQLGQQVPLQHQ